MEGINDVMYAMSIEVEWVGHSGVLALASGDANSYSAFDGFKFNIGLPGMRDGSIIECKVTLIGSAGRKEVFHEIVRLPMPGKRPADHPKPVSYWTTWPQTDADQHGYGGRMKIDDTLYQQAQVEIQYWPDPQDMPNFVLPKALDQRTLTGHK